MQTITVTIGRNVPQSQVDAALGQDLVQQIPGTVDSWSHYQLTADAWQNFTTLVREALESFPSHTEGCGWWIEQHDGVGEWEGIPEESRKLTLFYDGPRITGYDLQELYILLVSARSGFYQDAVAVSFGDSTLI